MGDILGAKIALRPAVHPAAVAAGPAQSNPLDALNSANAQWEDGVLVVQVGEITGTPDTTTVTAKIVHSDDGSNYVDAPVPKVEGQSAIGGANQIRTIRFNREALKRYVSATVVVGFTGGTTPTAAVSAVFIFGGALVRAVPG